MFQIIGKNENVLLRSLVLRWLYQNQKILSFSFGKLLVYLKTGLLQNIFLPILATLQHISESKWIFKFSNFFFSQKYHEEQNTFLNINSKAH